MKRSLSCWIVLMACTPTKPPPDPKHVEAVEAWRKERMDRLRSDGSWLTLVGLHWLREGENTVGSDKENHVVFPPSAPARIGAFHLTGEQVRFEGAAGAEVSHEGESVRALDLVADTQGKPTKLTLGSMTFHVIIRGDKVGVRVKDSQSAVRTGFTGIESFGVDTGWRVRARFEPYDPPRKLAIPTILETVDESPSPGALVFEHGGRTARLDAVQYEGSDQLFIIFGDETNGKETYGAGRFLYTDLPKDGTVEVDFNRAYNPPCVFTPYATCPLPPSQNRLALRVDAGEKMWGEHH